MRRITRKQGQVFEFIKSYRQKRGFSPTLEEIREGLKIGSIRSVTQFLETLESKGLIKRNRYVRRGIELIEERDSKTSLVSLPVFGSAGCGNPNVLAEQKFDEYISVSSDFIGNNNGRFFVIKAMGRSMIDAGISDGSFVLVEKTEDIKSGDLIVAIIENFAVIKKLEIANNAIILKPVSSDPEFKPIILGRDFQIFGKVIRIIKIEKPEDDYQIIYDKEY